jgi:GNAT superfamily N-acetyltransferase
MSGGRSARAVRPWRRSAVVEAPGLGSYLRRVTTAEDALATARRAEWIEAAMYADQIAAAPPEIAGERRLGYARAGRAVAGWCATSNVLAKNRLIGFGLDAPDDDATLDALLGAIEAAGPPRYMVQVAPPAAALADRLARRGFTHLNHWAKLQRRVGPIPDGNPDVAIEVVDAPRAIAWATILEHSFGHGDASIAWQASTVGRPRWIHYLASLDGLPVGSAAMFVEGDTALFSFAGTLETHRGRGIQSALIARRMRDAAERGCEWVVVETAEDQPEKPAPSYRNLRRLGFELLYLRPNWVKAPGR